MAADLVNSATSSKLAETDWSKNIAICELVARDHRQAKDVVKAIKKRVGNKHQHVQLYAVMLLEMLINNIGEPIHKQVVEGGILTSLVKIVKKKSDHPVRERIFLLLDAAQTSVGGASGRFPQYYSAYYELVSAGVKFPQRPRDIPRPRSTSNRNNNNPVDNRNIVPEPEANVSKAEEVAEPRQVLQNANSAMEVLRDVLDAIDTFFPEKAKDDITLEFVEQCSFAKQRVMHLALHTLDETVVTRAVEINEQLDRVLQRHYALLDVRVERSIRDAIEQQRKEEEREEAEQLFRRLQKGKACAEPEDENLTERNPFGFMGAIPGNILHRPLIRPLPTESKQEGLSAGKPAVVIPPPPVNHVERERFFRENRSSDSSGLSGHMRSLSLHSMTGSSSHSGSTDFSDRC